MKNWGTYFPTLIWSHLLPKWKYLSIFSHLYYAYSSLYFISGNDWEQSLLILKFKSEECPLTAKNNQAFQVWQLPRCESNVNHESNLTWIDPKFWRQTRARNCVSFDFQSCRWLLRAWKSGSGYVEIKCRPKFARFIKVFTRRTVLSNDRTNFETYS